VAPTQRGKETFTESVRRLRRSVHNRIAILLAALGLMFGAVTCGGEMEQDEDQQEQQQEEQDDD
jgi:hypothetical protein